jgi:hypothetical protein
MKISYLPVYQSVTFSYILWLMFLKLLETIPVCNFPTENNLYYLTEQSMKG